MPKCVLTLDSLYAEQFAKDIDNIQPDYVAYHQSALLDWFHVDLDISDESLSFLSLKYKLISTRMIRDGDVFRSWSITK